MQTIKITTSQNIDIDYEVAGVGERLLARLIDVGLFILIYILALIAYITVGEKISQKTLVCHSERGTRRNLLRGSVQRSCLAQKISHYRSEMTFSIFIHPLKIRQHYNFSKSMFCPTRLVDIHTRSKTINIFILIVKISVFLGCG